MTETATESRAWSGRQSGLFILLVFAAQLGFIFWLGDRNPIVPRPTQPGPSLLLADGASAEFFKLRDPTLFALPHQEGFAGLAWLTAKPPPLPVYDWTEEPHWLGLEAEKLGSSFALLNQADPAPAGRTPPMPAPDLRLPNVPALADPAPGSTVRVEGDGVAPHLLSKLEVPSWPPRIIGPTDTDLLTNSVVQVMIGPDGTPFSVTLLEPRSGSKAADDYALAKAREARFAPLPGYAADSMDFPRLTDLRWCRLVFEWHTSPATNPAAAQ